MQLDTLMAGTPLNHDPNHVILEIAHDISRGMFGTSAGMLETVGSTVGKFLDIMLEPIYDTGAAQTPHEPKRKKKKKKGQGQDNSSHMGR